MRFRESGFSVGLLSPGKYNAISDVVGVTVGHTTLIQGQNIRTGVTVIDPGVKDLFKQKLPAAVAIGNGYGKLAGSTQVEELGTLEAPIALTNTSAVGPVMQGLIDLVIRENILAPMDSINVIVAETNNGYLSDLHAPVITPQHVADAYLARSAAVIEGCVGAGTGTRAFSWKGGIGTASRQVIIDGTVYTVGVLVQTNYGGSLKIIGVPIGEILQKNDYSQWLPEVGDGSCSIVIATDAPLTARQLSRIARRSFIGLGNTGAVMAHASGDYAAAFTTSRNGLEGQPVPAKTLAEDTMTGFFLAAVEAVEESVYNAIFTADTVTGRAGNTWEKLPIDKTMQLLERYAYKE